jgi:murein DD-endopeptidase MepM/ murein hydrolase activator NlpD
MKSSPFKTTFIAFAVMLLLGASALHAVAETATELQAKINQHNADIAALEKEIAGYQAQLATAGKQADTLANKIKQLKLTGTKLDADSKLTQDKIDATTLSIQQLSGQIGDKETIIDRNTNAIAASLRQQSEIPNDSIFQSIVKQGSLSELWNEIQSLEDFQTSVRTKTAELRDAKTDLESTKTKTQAAQRDLIALKSQLSDQKQIVVENTKEQNKLLADTKNQQANYSKQLVDRIARKNALEKEIADYESQIKFILDPKTLPKAGVLSWPLDHIIITQQFGVTADSGRLYKSGSHNGTDFGASIGTPVKSMSNGTVVGTGNTDLTCPGASFGNWILIKYANGLSSTYGHLSLIKVKAGDKVTVGQVVGYSGNTGYTTGPHLHVSLYAAGAVSIQSFPSAACNGRTYTMPVAAISGYLDPLYYLPGR